MTKVVNLIIINDCNEILLAKRSLQESDDSGLWSIPGGTIEDGEDIEESLRREVKEELNCEIESMKLFYEFNFSEKIYSYYFYGKINGDIQTNEEISEVKWFTIDEIKSLKLAFKQNKIIDKFDEFLKGFYK
jgi:8-oxo-dGTP diphosphatase